MAKRPVASKSAALNGPSRWFRLPRGVWAIPLMLAAVAVGAHYLWRQYAPSVARHPQYVLTAERIHITPPPPWIRSDVKRQVLRDAGLAGNLSILDDWHVLTCRVQEAFEFHPWVESVERLAKRLPASLEIELRYRRPIAAVQSSDGGEVLLLPVDGQAVRLPESDLTDAERRHLPRIVGVTGRPLVGDVWTDPRVAGGAKLVAALADAWQQLRLVEVLATLRTPQNDTPRYTFELVTTGGTRIVWGAAPGQEASAGEAPFEQKRQRLLEYADKHADLESIDGPAAIDVRNDLIVTPRVAKRKEPNVAK